jgi:multiple antibiotic resistance protein
MNLEPLLLFFAASFSALFTIVNPFSTASIFLTVTRNDSMEKKKFMAKKACITAAIVLILFALIGNFILSFFSITLDAFKIAGGIIIGSIGMNMIHAGREHFHSDRERKEAMKKEDVSIIPLAIPMLSGPGAITTSIVLMGKTTGILDVILLITSIISVCLISYFVVSRANIIDKFLGENGRKIIDKLMGLIVLVIGVQFIINGIEGFIIKWFQ